MHLKTWLQKKSYHSGNSIRIVKGCSGLLGISQQLTLVTHRIRIGQIDKRIQELILKGRFLDKRLTY